VRIDARKPLIQQAFDAHGRLSGRSAVRAQRVQARCDCELLDEEWVASDFVHDGVGSKPCRLVCGSELAKEELLYLHRRQGLQPELGHGSCCWPTAHQIVNEVASF